MIGPTIAEAMAWYFSSVLYLLMPPLVGVVFLITWTALFAWRLMIRPGAHRATPDDVGLRPIGRSVPWLVVAILTAVILYLSFILASDHLFPHEAPSWDYFAKYNARAWGWAATTLVTVVVAPLMEEFIFRGVVQHALVRRFGPVVGISGAALLFSMIHLRPRQLADFFVFGAASGLLVYRTRSLWAGIATHSTINGCILLLAQKPDLPFVGNNHSATPLWGSVAVAVAAAMAFIALLSRIHSAPVAAPAAMLDSNTVAPSDAPPIALG